MTKNGVVLRFCLVVALCFASPGDRAVAASLEPPQSVDGGTDSPDLQKPLVPPDARAGTAALADQGVTPAAAGSTGPDTPPAKPQQDLFELCHRSIRVDDDLKILIEHQTNQAVRIKRLVLAYPVAAETDKKSSNIALPDNSKLGVGERDLTNYMSLDARGSVLHVDLARANWVDCRRSAPVSALCAWDYALWWNESASLLITYTVMTGDQEGKEPITVTLHPQITSRIRGVCWGLIGLFFSVALTILVGLYIKPKSFLAGANQPIEFANRPDRFWHYLLGITLSPENRYSVSALQVVIWTHVAAYGIAYVWTMTGQVVEITGQMLALLGVGGLTAVLSRFSTSNGVSIPGEFLKLVGQDRAPKLRDLVTSNDAPSIFKFQMLIFTALSASIVAWEVTRSYIFPVLPTELVLLMGISNATYLLGGVADKKDMYADLRNSMTAIDRQIQEHNESKQDGQAPKPDPQGAAPAPRWTRLSVVRDFLDPESESKLPEPLVSALRQFQEQLQRLFV